MLKDNNYNYINIKMNESSFVVKNFIEIKKKHQTMSFYKQKD